MPLPSPQEQSNTGHKERNTWNKHRNKHSSQSPVGCIFAWSPQLYPELCSSELGGSLHILTAGTGRAPGLPRLDSGLAHSGHGWASKAKLPSVSLKMLVHRQHGLNIRMQWAESKFNGSILSCAMCITLQLLVGKMFLILQIPGHLYG